MADVTLTAIEAEVIGEMLDSEWNNYWWYLARDLACRLDGMQRDDEMTEEQLERGRALARKLGVIGERDSWNMDVPK